MNSNADLLQIQGLSVDRLRKPVLRAVDLSIAAAERVALVGHNGAGKSTTLRSIIGLHHWKEGRVFFDGEDLSNSRTPQIVRRGISLSPQAQGFFPDLTVNENLGFARVRESYVTQDDMFELFPRLRDRRNQMVGLMSGGERQMVAIAVALMSGPKLLLLDEPSLGLAPNLVDDVFAALDVVHARFKIAMLLVEQNISRAADFADRMYVLSQGTVVRAGTPDQVMSTDVWEMV